MADYAIHEETLVDVSNVIRKKDGTSALIDPADYADRINLMGRLEEKTVSGAIATFADGADAVPLKKCEITLPASLDGYSEVDVVSAGKNLFNVADYSQIYTDRDGVDSYNYRYMIIQLKPNTTYTVSQNSGEYSGTPIILINNALPVGGANYFDLRKASDTKTYTMDSTGRLYIGSVNSYDDVTYERLQACKVQIEAGSTATTYEPYTAPTTHTATLGRTIYGGMADVVAGSGESTEKGKWLSELTWTQNASYPHIFNGEGFTDRKKNINWNNTTCLSDRYTGYTSSGIVTQSSGIALATGATSTRIYVADDRFETVADFVASLQNDDSFVVLPLETPEPFTFDPVPIDSKLGNNTIWSEQGSDTEVTYRSQGTAYIYPNAEEASF